MKNQQLKEQSILFLLSQNNFIVPEIQREYVWGSNPDVLTRFLDSLKNKIGDTCDVCGNPNTTTKINVGFLYTYKPSYVNYNYERYLDENLIDGQQRFTTLFLLLFYVALKENHIEDFRDAIRYDKYSELAFDYKVRNLTHIFILDLIAKVESEYDLGQLLSLKVNWLLKDFNQDVTVQSMINALRIIENKFKNTKDKYFNYILNNIKFYHFKTEATNQGEELYITMNARGEALSKNEENKAALMFDDSNLFDYGAKWEEWQDFFWKNREKAKGNSNADIGLNEFLRWIQIIEMTLTDNELDTDEDEKIDDKSVTKQIVTLIQGEHIYLNKAYFSIEKIETYFFAIQYIFDNFYYDKSYFSKYEGIVENLINREWLCPKEKTISQIDAFRFIPILHYVCRLLKQKKDIDNQNLFRLIKFLNNLRRDVVVAKTINKQVINAIKLVDNLLNADISDIGRIIDIERSLISKSLITPEERFKFSVYIQSSNRETFESAFWMAEDNKILKGKISPLLQFSYFEKNEENFIHSKSFEKFVVHDFRLNQFSNLYISFEKLTEDDKDKISSNVWAHLLLSEYYKVSDYNENHKTVTCISSDDFDLIRNICFLRMLYEIEAYQSVTEYFQMVFSSFLKNYLTIESLKDEIDLRKQLFIYYIALNQECKWDFKKGKNFGVYLKPNSFKSFFAENVRFQHFHQRWQGAEYNYFDDNASNIAKFYSIFFKN